ncbi:GRIP and coiled-coil domain-containing protein 2-like isoform X3 [Haliotis rufescens]|uniref:GRIP and coiled-coil domain-containing protein 2-like isoform X3 n=1 Tax=Haliotis rufescens TaxID=6454 RepID=UPI00201EA627|nr:GRIP and coiled-coil domain-containing protein 2-like isoform X3 [Haliotis rufescens]
MSCYDTLGYRGSPGRSPLRGVHDLTTMYPDSDSGISSTFRTKSRVFTTDDFSMAPTRLTRSRSMSRLNSGSRDTSPTGSVVSLTMPVDYSIRNLHDNLEDSETRRSVLMHKLKEAQETLSLQNNRLSKIETSAKDNAVIVEDLKFKEREYRKKIMSLEKAEEEKEVVQMENIRLRQEMQDRITALDFQLKSLQSQHQSSEVENNTRTSLLDQTTSCLSLLEEENTKLQKERDFLQSEVGSMKEIVEMTKANLHMMSQERNNVRNSLDSVTQENTVLCKKIHEMAGQMVELRTLLQAVQDENESLSSTWKNVSQDKHNASKQIENYQDRVADLKARLATVAADKDRLFQEKLDLNHKVQQLVLDKEQLIKVKLSLEEQITDAQRDLNKSRMSSNKKHDDTRKLGEELQGVKRVSQELSMELASVKAFYERALEQISLLENGKKMQQQHQELSEQEKRRLQGEVDRLTQLLDGRSREDRKGREELEDSMSRIKLMHSAKVLDGLSRFETDLKQLRNEKAQTDNHNRELEMKLQRANEEIRRTSTIQQEEMVTWKLTCERLTGAVTRKESELQSLTDKCHDTESIIRRLQEELRIIRDQYEALEDQRDDTDRLRSENRRMHQEKAENEQMIQLLETQKEVLTKSTESSLNKLHDVDHLSGKVEQFRSENELLRDRITELEKVRDNLIKQKEEVLANSELIYKKPGLDDLEHKTEELRAANKQLREINDVMSDKLEVVERENARLKQAIGGPSNTSEERLQRENKKISEDYTNLRNDYESLESRHQRMVINYGHEEMLEKEKQDMVKLRKERDALQKQVQLLNGQLVLVEGSKKRLEDTVTQLQETISRLKAKITEKPTGSDSGVQRLEGEVKSLKDKLSKSEAAKQKQDQTVKNLKDESLEDVGEELHQMRGELHKLMEEIERKDREILSLENELRKTKEELDLKDHGISDLRKLVEDLEKQNKSLKQNKGSQHDELDSGNTVRLTRGSKLPKFVSPAVSGSAKPASNTAPRSLQEELQDALKKKESSVPRVIQTDPLLSKKFLEAKPAPPSEQGKLNPATGLYGAQFFFKPEKSSTEGSGRLQSLISKYRSHSDATTEEPEKKVKPFSFTTGRLGFRGKGVTLTTPKVPDSKSPSSSDQTGFNKLGVGRSGSKGPPPPTLPKPKVRQEVVAGASRPQGGLEPGATSGAEAGEGQGNLQDTQEQKDINALIQKRGNTHPKPILSVNPPKLTSKVIAQLLRPRGRGKSSDKSLLCSS